MRSGSHAEVACTDQRAVWRIPDGLSPLAAAGVPLAFATAHDSLFRFGKLRKGQAVIITGGSGAVGRAAIQMARHAGAHVFTTTTHPDKAAHLQRLGAAVVEFADEEPADLVVDNVGGPALLAVAAKLRSRGRIVLIGDLGRQPTQIPGRFVATRGLVVIGYHFFLELGSPRLHRLVSSLLDEVRAGTLETAVDRVFPFKDVAEAHNYVENGSPWGRVFLELPDRRQA
jgi:NADPH2:quinone reductase